MSKSRIAILTVAIGMATSTRIEVVKAFIKENSLYPLLIGIMFSCLAYAFYLNWKEEKPKVEKELENHPRMKKATIFIGYYFRPFLWIVILIMVLMMLGIANDI